MGRSAVISSHHIEHQCLVVLQITLIIQVQSRNLIIATIQVNHVYIIIRIVLVGENSPVIPVRLMIVPITERSVEQILFRILHTVIQVQVMHEHTGMTRIASLFSMQHCSIRQMKNLFIISRHAIEIAWPDPVRSTELRFLMIDLSRNTVFAP